MESGPSSKQQNSVGSGALSARDAEPARHQTSTGFIFQIQQIQNRQQHELGDADEPDAEPNELDHIWALYQGGHLRVVIATIISIAVKVVAAAPISTDRGYELGIVAAAPAQPKLTIRPQWQELADLTNLGSQFVK